eukprot:292870-Pyramimonas_sp.AAC.1
MGTMPTKLGRTCLSNESERSGSHARRRGDLTPAADAGRQRGAPPLEARAPPRGPTQAAFLTRQ